MKHRLVQVWIFVVLLFAFSCEKDPISADVLECLNRMMDIMEKNSIMRNQINWTDFRDQVLEKAVDTEPSAQKWAGVREALTLLGDNHSFVLTSSGRYIWGEHTLVCEAESTLPVFVPDQIGYVQVFHFSGSSNSDAALDFARDIQDQIRRQDDSTLIGWIVDLRGNGGGNMYPMLAGIGPILGEGTAGYFVTLTGGTTTWRYVDGASFAGGYTQTRVEDSYELIHENPKVAVLIDDEVMSSGEAIAISFIGRPNTKSFGTATCGRSTANSGFQLIDGSTLYLAVAYMVDRNLNQFGGPVNPDVEADANGIIGKAVEWLENE